MTMKELTERIKVLEKEIEVLGKENERLLTQNKEAEQVLRFVKEDCKESVRYKLGIHKADPPSAECVKEWNQIEKMQSISAINAIAASNWSASTPQPTKPRTKMTGSNNL